MHGLCDILFGIQWSCGYACGWGEIQYETLSSLHKQNSAMNTVSQTLLVQGKRSALMTESDYDHTMNTSSDSCVQREDSGCECQTSQSSELPVSSYAFRKENIDAQPQSGEEHSYSNVTLSPESSVGKSSELPVSSSGNTASKPLLSYQRSESLPFVVNLKQNQNGIGLILGTSGDSGLVCITDMLSTGSAAQDGNLK